MGIIDRVVVVALLVVLVSVVHVAVFPEVDGSFQRKRWKNFEIPQR